MAHVEQLHSQTIRLSSNNDTMGHLIKLGALSQNGHLSYNALKLFDEMPQSDTFIYNTITRDMLNS